MAGHGKCDYGWSADGIIPPKVPTHLFLRKRESNQLNGLTEKDCFPQGQPGGLSRSEKEMLDPLGCCVIGESQLWVFGQKGVPTICWAPQKYCHSSNFEFERCPEPGFGLVGLFLLQKSTILGILCALIK